MKVGKKTVLAAVYIVVALIAYISFINYSHAKYEEELAIRIAEWVAEGRDPRWYDYFFIESIHYRNLVWGGCILGLGSPFVILAMFKVVDMTEKKKVG